MNTNLLRRSILITLLLAAIGAGGTQIATAATAADTPKGPGTSGRRHIAFQATFDPAGFFPPVCDSAGQCVFALGRTGSRFSGAFEGTSVSVGAGTPTQGGFVGTGVHVFTGTIKGCGHGSLVFTETLNSVDGVTSRGTWQVVNGSGSGGFDVRGGGTFTAVQQPDGSGVVSSVGRIRC